jgi:nucleoside-diphosphate-sugar epimerase
MSNLILLTGGSGFIGSKILENLLIQKYKVRLVLRAGTKLNNLISDKSIDSIIYSDDIFNESDNFWDEACNGVTNIIHAAWYTEPSKYLDSNKNFECLTGTLKILNSVVRNNVKNFIGLGTCAEYKFSNKPLKRDSPILPNTIYASCKAAVYFIAKRICEENNINFSWCRLFYVYGENDHKERLFRFVKDSLENNKIVKLYSGDKVRDFINVNDAALKIVSLINSKECGAINICSGKAIKIEDFVLNIAKQYKKTHLVELFTKEHKSFDPPYIVGVP